jgi:hypothetical protein
LIWRKRRATDRCLFERPFRLHREADGDFGRAVENLNQMIAEQASELALRTRFGNQFDPAITSPASGTDDIGFLHGQNDYHPTPMIPTEAAANKSPSCRAIVTWRDGRAAIHPPARPTIAPGRRLSETKR